MPRKPRLEARGGPFKRPSEGSQHAGISYDILDPPFDTKALRAGLRVFLNQQYEYTEDSVSKSCRLGAVKWGVYAFYDYENEPIYVGQTYESLGSRIGRHLTNQRTDAVAMNVLDPFEVCYIEVWPLTSLEHAPRGDAIKLLGDMEYAVHLHAIARSRFKAILNEVDPRRPTGVVPTLPPSVKGKITSEVEGYRSHPDIRIARRAQVLARLAQVISERQVRVGLRRTLRTQARRLAWLADARFEALLRQGMRVESGTPDEESTD